MSSVSYQNSSAKNSLRPLKEKLIEIRNKKKSWPEISIYLYNANLCLLNWYHSQCFVDKMRNICEYMTNKSMDIRLVFTDFCVIFLSVLSLSFFSKSKVFARMKQPCFTQFISFQQTNFSSRTSTFRIRFYQTLSQSKPLPILRNKSRSFLFVSHMNTCILILQN